MSLRRIRGTKNPLISMGFHTGDIQVPPDDKTSAYRRQKALRAQFRPEKGLEAGSTDVYVRAQTTHLVLPAFENRYNNIQGA